jgi:hypothetical protein
MNKFKVFITSALYLASCAFLCFTHGVVSALLQSYTIAYPSSIGSRVLAFTSFTLTLMPQSAAICFGMLGLSALLVAVALSRSATSEAKLYWVTAVAGFNYYVSGYLLATVLTGFFLLPRLANGI